MNIIDIDELVERLHKEASFLSANRSLDDTDDLLIEAATALSFERAAHEYTKRERDEKAAMLIEIRNKIPMDYLKAHDVPGATGPTPAIDLVAAMSDYSKDRWRLIDRLRSAETRLAEVEKALTALVELNNNYSPFGGELFQDRVERTWEAASRALGGNKDD